MRYTLTDKGDMPLFWAAERKIWREIIHSDSFFQYVYQKDGRSAACPHTGRKELEEWQHDFRKALWERLGLNRLSALADGVESSGVRLVSSCREEGYLRQKYVMQTLPFVEMPFYVLIPDGGGRRKSGQGHADVSCPWGE